MNTNYKKHWFRCAIIILFLHIIFTTGFMLQAQTPNPVGAIPGVIDVSPMGAATYTIPIEVVPGTMGMQPNLSIVYNSMSGMGLLGMKWSLAGLSAITRCGQTPYYDNGNMTAIQFGANDRFAIDGERLLRINNGSYGAKDGEYATEVENFMRVYSHGVIDRPYKPPTHFTAYTDDGSIIEYGHTTDSKQKLGSNNHTIISWCINKITDANGNYMTFEYAEYGSEKSIKRIHYTGNLTMDTYATVEFEYSSVLGLWGSNTYFVSGYGIPQDNLLNKITVSYKDTVVRKYEFHYNMNIWESGQNRTAHLEKIALSGVEGTKELNPTWIEWGNKNTSIEEKSTNVGCAKSITGDFNGDGHSDIIYYAEEGSLQGYYGNQGWDLALYNPTTKLFNWAASEVNVTCNIMYAQDVNGDGKDELIIGNILNNGTGPLQLRILSLPSKTQIGSTLEYNIFSSPLDTYALLGHVDFGDFDGDGTTDILLYEADGRGYTVGNTTIPIPPYLLTLKKIEGNSIVNMCNPLNIGTDAKIIVLDANGNGKKNIQVERNGTTTIYEFNGSYLETKNTNPAYHSYSHKYYGDVNGDGITDVLVFCYEDQVFKWKIFIAKGDGTFIEGYQGYPECDLSSALDITAANPSEGNASAPQYEPRFADINGDGKEDIIQRVGNSFIVLYSKGVIWGCHGFIKETISFNNPSDIYTNWCLGDFDGVGKLQFLLTHPERVNVPIFQKIISINQGNDYEFVKKITDGMGKKIELSYKHKYFIANSSPWSNVFPSRKKKYLLSTVDSLRMSNGIDNGLNTLKYKYDNAVYSLPRRTFLGFESFVSINNQNNRKDSCSFSVNFGSTQMLFPRRQKSFCYDEKISEKEYIIFLESLSSYRYAPYYALIDEFDILSDTYTMSHSQLNDEGRLQESKTVTWALSEFCYGICGISVETKNYTYHDISLSTSNSYHKKTVPQTIITTQGYRNPNNQCVEITDTLTYGYGAQGRLAWMRKGNLDGSITTTYGDYSNTGVYREKVVSAAGCEPRTEKYLHDDTRRFVERVANLIDPVNEIRTRFTYDPKTGNKLTETDPNDLVTNYNYDTFGNLTQINYPNGTQTNISVSWYTGRDLPNARFFTTTTSTGKSDLIVYYDILGREVCRLADGYYLETHYNDKGLVKKTSHLFQDFRHPDRYKTWHEYTYDDLGRKIKETAPYTHLLYEYNEREVTVTDSLRDVSSSKTYDALGRIVSATDHGGTIAYQYEITSNKKHKTTIKVNNTAATTILSDLWGNRLSITEPNAGTITSEYNKFNELVKQTDARGNITTYQYDKLGRVTQKHFIGSSPVNYVYDVANHGVGKLQKVSQGTPTQEVFSYDAFGRLATHTKSIDANAALCKHSYTYNANGQLHTLTYPSGFGVTYSYTGTGKLNEIRRSDNDDLIYKVSSRNKYQQPNRCYYGNDAATDYTYDTHGLLTRINTGNKITIGIEVPIDTAIIDPGGTDFSPGTIGIIGVDSAMLNYRYAYNARGLMTSRSESVIDRLETYKYDVLDRLTEIKSGAISSGSMQTQQFYYYNNGNISTNSNVGYYTYGSKPHAVSLIEPVSTNVISNNQCDVIYNSFNQPTKITEGNSWLDLSYDVNQQRQKVVRYKNGSEEMIRYHINKGYEIEREPSGYHRKYYHYIYGDNGVVALYIGGLIIEPDTTGGGTDPQKGINFTTDSMYYIHTDHLGSYCAITNANKEVKQRNYFDPWGNFRLIYRTRNGFNMEEALPPTDSLEMETIPSMNFKLIDRGFTGHEHYPYFKIINMNGRLYDPVIGRFFSPDKYVANSTFTQDYNRYTYARNNPLMYTDPSGELPWLVPMIAGFAINAISYTASVAASDGGFQNWDWGQFAFASLSGVATGALGAGVGAVLSSAGVGGFFNGFISGTVTGAANGLMNGINMKWTTGNSKDFWRSFGIGVGTGALFGGFMSGFDAMRDGKSFWHGGYRLKDKLAMMVAQNRAALDAAAGVADANVHLGTRDNVRQYGDGHTYEWGNIFNSDGDLVNAFAVNGNEAGRTAGGYVQYGNNNIVVDKNTVRSMWRGDIGAFETLYHEWYHCHLYSTGSADFMVQTWGVSQAKIHLEVMAHSYSLSRLTLGTPAYGERLATLDYYKRLSLGIFRTF